MGQVSRSLLGAEAASDGVIPWRRERLLAAGFHTTLAAALAANREVDLHALLELVDRGCSPELAARILAPLDRERSS